MSDLISRELMKSLGGACIARRLKNGDLCPIISIDLLPSAEPEERTKERTETHACDCISRQAAIDVCNSAIDLWHGQLGEGALVAVKEGIEGLPSAEPERKKGKWEIYVISMFDGEGCRCSECGFEGAPYWDFCPNCGSYNGGEQDETD